MYFCRLRLDPRAAIRNNVYDAHQALWRLFSDDPDRKRDFLYREIDDRTYLAVSARAPEDHKGMWTVEVKPYAPRLSVGDRLFVSLRANAVVKRGRERHDVVQEARMKYLKEDQEPPPRAELAQGAGWSWLEARQRDMGLCFEKDSVVVSAYEPRRFFAHGRKVCIGTLDFQGFARVEDAERGLRTLCMGVGPAKGFGCGLMLARRS